MSRSGQPQPRRMVAQGWVMEILEIKTESTCACTEWYFRYHYQREPQPQPPACSITFPKALPFLVCWVGRSRRSHLKALGHIVASGPKSRGRLICLRVYTETEVCVSNGFSPVSQPEPHRRGFRDIIVFKQKAAMRSPWWMNINHVIDSL